MVIGREIETERGSEGKYRQVFELPRPRVCPEKTRKQEEKRTQCETLRISAVYGLQYDVSYVVCVCLHDKLCSAKENSCKPLNSVLAKTDLYPVGCPRMKERSAHIFGICKLIPHLKIVGLPITTSIRVEERGRLIKLEDGEDEPRKVDAWNEHPVSA
jgi:hypothetical protein